MLPETRTSIPLSLAMYAAKIRINGSRFHCPYLDHLFHHYLPIYLFPLAFALLLLKIGSLISHNVSGILCAVSALFSPLLSTISERYFEVNWLTCLRLLLQHVGSKFHCPTVSNCMFPSSARTCAQILRLSFRGNNMSALLCNFQTLY